MVNRMYRLEAGSAVKEGGKVPLLITIPLVLLAAGVVVLGFWPNLVSGLTDSAGQVLVALFAR